MDLSVIIVSYNVKYFLDLCLYSVRKASGGIECEIFVVDNNSSDGSVIMVSRNYPEVKLIANSENKGFSAANNQAIRLASGKYILLLNPDTIIGEETFKQCIRFMDDHPDAGATGVRMINGKGSFLPESKRALPEPATAFYKITGLSYLFPGSAKFNRYYLGNIDNNYTSRADVISGAFMFLRKEAVTAAGLLDEAFFMYGEDIDYSYRLLKKGFNNYYYPEAKIIHFKGESTKKEKMDFVINFYNAMLIFVMKHFNNGNLKRIIFPVRIAVFIRAGLSVIKMSVRRLFLPFYKTVQTVIHRRSSSTARTNTLIISDNEGCRKISELLTLTKNNPGRIIRISIDHDDFNKNVPGNAENLCGIIKKDKIGQIIFQSDRLSLSLIIHYMQIISHNKITFRIASPGEKYLLSSGSVMIPENDRQVYELSSVSGL